jgi:chemotaxis response regulator CheB
MLTVLLIEDDDDIRTLVRTRLELDGGFTVVGEAVTGAHGVRLAKVHQPDVVVLDVIMPVLDGARTLPLIRVVAPSAAVVTYSALTAEHPRVARIDSDGHICKTDGARLPDALREASLARAERLAV